MLHSGTINRDAQYFPHAYSAAQLARIALHVCPLKAKVHIMDRYKINFVRSGVCVRTIKASTAIVNANAVKTESL